MGGGTVVLAAAVERELSDLTAALEDGRSVRIGRIVFARAGSLEGQKVLVCATGMGKINAAATLAALCEHQTPSGILSIGVGGAYPGTGLGLADLALASEEILADDGV